MAYPVGTPWTGSVPSPAYSGTFIPQIWSGKMIEKFYDATVLGAIANTDYEGEIRNQGDLVRIRTKPTLTIRDYQAEQALTYERPGSSVVDLQIDKGKYFNTVLDDVMQVQSDLDQLSMWADDASEQMKIAIDTIVLASIDAAVSANNKGSTAGRISHAYDLGATGAGGKTIVARNAGTGQMEVLDMIVNMGTVLDESNIPEAGRWLIIPAWMAGMIKRSELRDAALSGDGTSIERNGRLGMIDRFTLYASNLLPVATGTNIFAGHKNGLTFASQLTKVETLRAESTFGTILRGLQVFGSKVIDGTAIVSAWVIKG
jgi:hypothetical protein